MDHIYADWSDMDDDRDYAEEAYWRNWCDECQTSHTPGEHLFPIDEGDTFTGFTPMEYGEVWGD